MKWAIRADRQAPVIRLPDGHSSARDSEDIGLNCTRQKEMMSTW
jgi:hypothetical protein